VLLVLPGGLWLLLLQLAWCWSYLAVSTGKSRESRGSSCFTCGIICGMLLLLLSLLLPLLQQLQELLLLQQRHVLKQLCVPRCWLAVQEYCCFAAAVSLRQGLWQLCRRRRCGGSSSSSSDGSTWT
jgi:hypothetical protein